MSPKTNDIGIGKLMVSFSLPVLAEKILSKAAAVWRWSRSKLIRCSIVEGLRSMRHPLANEIGNAMGIASIHDDLPAKKKAQEMERQIFLMQQSVFADANATFNFTNCMAEFEQAGRK